MKLPWESYYLSQGGGIPGSPAKESEAPMNTVHVVPAASNAAPPPVRPAARPEFTSAYTACKSHPAYGELIALRNHLVQLRDLCEQFTEKYHPDTIKVFLRTLGFRSRDLSEDFAHVHADVLGAVWLLDMLRAGIDPSLVLPFDLAAGAKKGGAV